MARREEARHRPGGRTPLDRATVLAAAVAMADAEGTAGVSMRRLADRLGFAVMALYNHVRSKDELLALMVDAVAAEVPPPDPGLPPMAAVRAHALDTRAAFVRHPWAPPLWLESLPGPERVDHMEALLAVLARSGLDPETAHHGFHAVNNHVIGYTLQEQAMAFPADDLADRVAVFLASVSADTHPLTVAHVHEHLGGRTESSFELVLDLILDGLVRRG
ncbi:TetR/AcrR family transcriptional regulator [Phycicoccus flavus]|uniref:TetR/AcrR family transcriptional regulator n=1 Tax=Phycicoccus flavus TaxID=2502783 RepID=A0A8T6QXU2_9MICO|nr:TetR/AcrR family transcriptional regulator C-terminal domain-containing protein [Phycicoccus flavus]NHA66679.1 TetR/AcrR family transcriptional regulator [Phycicoccus flavus]